MIHWMFTDIDISRRAHCAVHNLTGDLSRRASPDACGPPLHTLGLSAGVPHLPVVCGGPKPDGDCRLPVVHALQRVPYGACVSRQESRHTGRPRLPPTMPRPPSPLGSCYPKLTTVGDVCSTSHLSERYWFKLVEALE